MAKKRRKKKKQKPKSVAEGQARAAGIASTTFGRSRRFKDRKKEADKRRCRDDDDERPTDRDE